MNVLLNVLLNVFFTKHHGKLFMKNFAVYNRRNPYAKTNYRYH